jgi:Flp pilus assembly protein TadG
MNPRESAAKKHSSKHPQRSERAQIILLLALTLPVLIGAMAMSADVGVLYFNWQRLQSAADAGAVAGAAYLPANSALAISTANSFVAKNGILPAEITSTTVSSDAHSLNIQLLRNVPYSFALLLGLVTGNVSAQATAQIQTIGKAIGVTPMGIDYRTTYSSGQVVTLMQGQVGPGNWGPLALGASGASNLLQNIEYGYQGSIATGDLVTTETGLSVGPIRSSFNFLITAGQNSDPGGTFASHTATDQRVLIVPMVDFSSINGNSQVPVKGFAALWLVSDDSQNNIQTYFINQVAPGSTPDITGTSTNYGAFEAVLIQ